MEQTRRYWQPEQGWVSAETEAPQRPPRVAGDGRGTRQPTGGPLPAAPAQGAGGIGSPSLSDNTELTPPDRRARVADLRRAIILSEVIGTPRALRGDGMHW